MAIPFFILSGNLMTEGGISKRLLEFAGSVLGNIRGSIAMACILACAFFAALSGSGPATVVAIGSMVFPELVARKYPAGKMAGMIAVSGGLGPIIPPSIIMVIYCTVTDNSIRALFAAGFSVGFLLTIGLLVVTYVPAVIEKWPVTGEKFTAARVWASFKYACFALVMPVIILGGIYGGVFTPTEAAAVSVAYSLVIGLFVYRTIRLPACARPSRSSRRWRARRCGACSSPVTTFWEGSRPTSRSTISPSTRSPTTCAVWTLSPALRSTLSFPATGTLSATAGDASRSSSCTTNAVWKRSCASSAIKR